MSAELSDPKNLAKIVYACKILTMGFDNVDQNLCYFFKTFFGNGVYESYKGIFGIFSNLDLTVTGI